MAQGAFNFNEHLIHGHFTFFIVFLFASACRIQIDAFQDLTASQ